MENQTDQIAGLPESGSSSGIETGELKESLHPRLAWMLCYEETGSAREVCNRFKISGKTFYKWLRRYRKSNGDSGSLTDRSRRPHHSPRATPAAWIDLLKQAQQETGFGQRRLRTYVQEKYNVTLSERTIWKVLKT